MGPYMVPIWWVYGVCLHFQPKPLLHKAIHCDIRSLSRRFFSRHKDRFSIAFLQSSTQRGPLLTIHRGLESAIAPSTAAKKILKTNTTRKPHLPHQFQYAKLIRKKKKTPPLGTIITTTNKKAQSKRFNAWHCR